MNRFKMHIKILLITLLLLFVAELLSRILFPVKKGQESCLNCSNNDFQGGIGIWHKPSYTHRAKKDCSPQVNCYDVVYEYDLFGRRKLEHDNSYDKHLLIFGGSFAFGEGLNSKSTLAFKLSQSTEMNIYNYSKSAMGSALTLSLLKNKNIEKEVSESRGIAIYVLPSFHVARESITTQRPWAWMSNAYVLENNKLEFYDTQRKSIGWKIYLYEIYNWLRVKSNILTMAKIEFSPTTLEEKNKNLALVLAEASKTYERKFKGQFYVVGHPMSLPTTEMINELKLNNVKYIEFKQLGSKKSDLYLCPCDRHPNATANTLLNNQLVDWINSL